MGNDYLSRVNVYAFILTMVSIVSIWFNHVKSGALLRLIDHGEVGGIRTHVPG